MTCPQYPNSRWSWRSRLLLGLAALGIAVLLSSCGEDEGPAHQAPRSERPSGYAPPAAPPAGYGYGPATAPPGQWGQPQQQWGQPPQAQWGQAPQQWGGPQGSVAAPQQWGGQQGMSAGVQGQWGAGGMPPAPPPADNPWRQPPAGFGGPAAPQRPAWGQPQPSLPQFRPLEEERAKDYYSPAPSMVAPYDRPIGSSQDRQQPPAWPGYPGQYPATPPGYMGVTPTPWGWPGGTGVPPVW